MAGTSSPERLKDIFLEHVIRDIKGVSDLARVPMASTAGGVVSFEGWLGGGEGDDSVDSCSPSTAAWMYCVLDDALHSVLL